MTFKMPIVSKDEMALRFHQNWCEQNPDDASSVDNGSVDDCLTDLNWLQNLNIMTKIGAPTPETPPASPVPSPECYGSKGASTSYCLMTDLKGSTVLKAKVTPCKHVPQDVDYKTNGSVKPPYSYATLICMAMKANKNKMTLSSIYKWIKENFMYYRNADPSWQNSIRHNLSLNKCFIKIPRSKDEPGKGGFWRLDPEYAESLVDGVFKKRRPAQRQSNGAVTSKKSKKDRHKVQNGTITRVVDSFQQDTPPSSAGSLLGHAEMELMTDIKPIMMSPSHHEAYIAAANICDYQQTDHHLMVRSQRSQDKSPLGVKEEYLQVLEPLQQHTTMSHGMTSLHNGRASSNSHQQGGQNQGDLCWNEVLGEPDLELESLYKYRPEESISSVVNTALALNEDLFSSDGSSSDLPNELDLVSTACTDQLDLGGGGNGAGVVGNGLSQTDWWGCFPHSSFDLSLTPVLSISVPFNGGNHQTTNNNGGVFVNGYVQNPQGTSYIVDRPQSQEASQPWAECKAALEAAALDLDDLGDLDPVHAY